MSDPQAGGPDERLRASPQWESASGVARVGGRPPWGHEISFSCACPAPATSLWLLRPCTRAIFLVGSVFSRQWLFGRHRRRRADILYTPFSSAILNQKPPH